MVFPNLKPSTATITLRLPAYVLDRIKAEANKRDVPYKALIKTWLHEQVTAEAKPTAAAEAPLASISST